MMKAWFKSVLPRLGGAYVDTAVVVYGSDFTGWPDRDAGLPGGTAHLSSRDARWVEKLMAKTRRSPTGRAALDWAAAHDIRFEVSNDKTLVASYQPGKGIVKLRRGWGTKVDAASLVHEVRHAWQDHYGLVPAFKVPLVLKGDLGRQLIQQALLEADAHAHGEMVDRELRLGQPTAAEAKTEMNAFFSGWIERYAKGYHAIGLRRVLLACAVQEIDAILEHTPERNIDSAPLGIDPWWRSDINLLGRSFAGVNYLSGMTREERDHMRVTILMPATALAAFNPKAKHAAWLGKEYEVRKIQLREKLKTPLKRLPLPG